MWTEFEWENKVNVSTSIDNLRSCEFSTALARLFGNATHSSVICSSSPHRPRTHHVLDEHGLPHSRCCPRRRLWFPFGEPLRAVALRRGRPRELVDRETRRRNSDGSRSNPIEDSRYRFVIGRSHHGLPKREGEVVFCRLLESLFLLVTPSSVCFFLSVMLYIPPLSRFCSIKTSFSMDQSHANLTSEVE